MPKRTDIHRILLLGSGPIRIGQAAEFDFSGSQACRALRAEGYEVILVNSNPATIMTDPDFSDRTYIEPLNVETLEKEIWQHSSELETHTVETHIYRLRKKIKAEFGNDNLIKSNKNGYTI